MSDVGDQLSENDSNASETVPSMQKGQSRLCLKSFCIKDTVRMRQDDPSNCRTARFHPIYRLHFISLCRMSLSGNKKRDSG